MRNFIFYFILSLLCVSCNDDVVLSVNDLKDQVNETVTQEGMQRVVASSPDEIKYLISQMGDGTKAHSRSLSSINYSENEDPFVSLIEANRRKVMESLTKEQLDSILNDEDELEFCPADSVIADIQFAMLLNADREIQVGDNVYKYLPNGVAFTCSENANELKTVESITSNILVTQANEGVLTTLPNNINFLPVRYEVVADDNTGVGSFINEDEDPNSRGNGTEIEFSGIALENGVKIPLCDIRDINYESKGDGNWLHRTWSGLWGKNVVAIKKFNSHKKLNLNFYDQNYLVYANIGTKLKMQKKVCGIWWNIKADEMVQGWETVTIKYKMPTPIIEQVKNPFNGKNDYPTYMWNPFPYGKDNQVLLNIPFVDYNFTTSDLNKAFKAGLKLAWSRVSKEIKNLINNDQSRAGLMSFNNKDSYVIYGPFSKTKTNAKSMESKFYTKWLPGTYEFGFSIGSALKLVKASISGNDGVELYRGIVYGAIKYKGKWVAARITKDR